MRLKQAKIQARPVVSVPIAVTAAEPLPLPATTNVRQHSIVDQWWRAGGWSPLLWLLLCMLASQRSSGSLLGMATVWPCGVRPGSVAIAAALRVWVAAVRRASGGQEQHWSGAPAPCLPARQAAAFVSMHMKQPWSWRPRPRGTTGAPTPRPAAAVPAGTGYAVAFLAAGRSLLELVSAVPLWLGMALP